MCLIPNVQYVHCTNGYTMCIVHVYDALVQRLQKNIKV
jgi:hypothetical protein